METNTAPMVVTFASLVTGRQFEVIFDLGDDHENRMEILRVAHRQCARIVSSREVPR